MDRLTRLLTVAIVLGGLIGVSQPARAVSPSVSFVAPAGLLQAGRTVAVEVHLDSGGQLINAFQLRLKYSPIFLRPIQIVKQQQFWPLWPEEPSWDETTGTISLAGGRPNGLIAVNAPVATVTFQIVTGGLTQVVFDPGPSGMYLNDGHGTKVNLTGAPIDLNLADALVPTIALDPATTPTPGQWSNQNSIHVRWAADPNTRYSFLLADDSQALPDETPKATNGSLDYANLTDGVHFWSVRSQSGTGLWSTSSQYRFLLDTLPPHPFSLTALDPRSVGGHHAISWVTTDDVSGVANATLLVNGQRYGLVTSPLLIKSSWRGATLTVVVRDQAGNAASATYRVPGTHWPSWWWVSGMLVGLILLGFFLTPRRRWRRR